MKQKKDETKASPAAPPAGKRAYRAPQLRKFGTLAGMTAKSSFGGDRLAKKF